MNSISDRNPPMRLRILMIAPQYRPLVGGYERAAERLSAALSHRGHQVTVITDQRKSSWLRHEIFQGVTIRRLWCIFRPRLHMPTSLMSLALFLLKNGCRFDVWHVHQYGLHAAVAVAFGLLLRRPVVLKLTSSGEQGIAMAMGQHPLARIVTHLQKRASAIIALTRETASEALAIGIPSSRIHQLGNGVDITSYRPRGERERAELKAELGVGCQNIFICVGRLAPDKGLDGLLRAWQLASDHLPAGWGLVMVGEGEMRERLSAMVARLGSHSPVMMVGPQQDVAKWLGASDVYLSASKREGLSNTLLEAMATGLPSAVTRVSGVTDLVAEPNAGFVVNVSDVDAMTAAIVDLAANADIRLNMGQAARRKIENSYSMDAVTNAHERLYWSLVRRSSR